MSDEDLMERHACHLARRLAELEAERDRLKMEVVGYEKAFALHLKGMESLAELYDYEKHRCRTMEQAIAEALPHIEDAAVRARLMAALASPSEEASRG